MNKYYCPQHRGRAKNIIDTWLSRCGTCCKMNGGPGTPNGDCCPALWCDVSPEDFAANHARQPFTDDEYTIFESSYFVDVRAWDKRK